MPALTESGTQVAFQAAATTLAQGLGADRTVVVFLDGAGQLTVGAVHGCPGFHLHDSPISVTLLTQVVTNNRTVVYSNVATEGDTKDNLSLHLSGAVSLLCIPFYDEGGTTAGALYADTSKKRGAFHRRELLFARDCARWLEGCLLGKDSLERPEMARATPPAPAARSASAEVAPAKPRRSRLQPVSDQRVGAASLMVFFRAFSTLVGAGVMIHDGLDLLARSCPDPKLARVLESLSAAIQEGEPLSGAMARFPQAFPGYLRSAVRVGERSGRLVHILSLLSSDLEKGQSLVYKVRSALAYPAILTVLCGGLLILGPPFLLEGHLRMLAQSGVALPWMTRAMILISGLMRSPMFFLALLAGVGVAAAWARQPQSLAQLWSWAYRVPLVGKMLGLLAMSRFTRALALQLAAGLTALESLEQARAGCHDARLRSALASAESALRSGETLADAFASTGTFSPIFLSFVEAGEASGTLPRLADWLADFMQRDLEAGLESFILLLEPIVLGVMGVVATVLLLATLKPTLLLLQTL